MPMAGRVANQPHLKAVRDGVTVTMPFIIVGSIFLIIGFLPINGYPEFMASVFGEAWRSKLMYPVTATMDMMALVISFSVAYYLAKHYNVDAISSGMISLTSFFLITPFEISTLVAGETVIVGGIPISLMGSKGMFVAIVLALISAEIYRYMIQKNIVIKMPEGVPSAVSQSFAALAPATVVILAVWLLRLIIEMTPFGDLHQMVTMVLSAPLNEIGGSLFGAIVAVFLIGLFWGFGIHGIAVVGAVTYPIWYALRDENRMAFQAGDPLPNIITHEFFMNFVFLGGSGATLALALLMMMRGRSQQMKSMGRLSIGGSIFNINEPIVFGTPVMMNPIIMIPFIMTPVVIAIVTWAAMKTGLVAIPVGIGVPWTLPIGLSGYLATGGKISGAVMQFVSLGLAMAIYYPFFAIHDKRCLTQEQKMEAETQQPSVAPTIA